jgi:hypothetical protein
MGNANSTFHVAFSDSTTRPIGVGDPLPPLHPGEVQVPK